MQLVYFQVSIRQSSSRDCSIHQIMFPSLTCSLVGHVMSTGEWSICRNDVSHFSTWLKKSLMCDLSLLSSSFYLLLDDARMTLKP